MNDGGPERGGEAPPPSSTPATTVRRKGYVYQQLGAPSLVYEAENEYVEDRDGNAPYVDDRILLRLPVGSPRSIYEEWKGGNRVRSQWYYSFDRDAREEQLEKSGVIVIDRVNNSDNGDEDNDNIVHTRASIFQNRMAMLLGDDDANERRHRKLIHTQETFEYPYVTSAQEKRGGLAPKMLSVSKVKQEINLGRVVNSDPSYLAPFDLGSLKEASTIEKEQIGAAPRLPQGNALLTAPCPCIACARKHTHHGGSWFLLHPVGLCLERLCVSLLVSPLQGDGIIRKGTNLKSKDKSIVDLGDTILEVRQAGKGTFVARTGTHVSVVSITCSKKSKAEDECSGVYVIKEKERLQQRSLFRHIPSFVPISLASHPRYGIPFSPSKFAIVSHASSPKSGTTRQNTIHSCDYDATDGKLLTHQQHDISNLRSIISIDYTTSHPMCLWSASSSYIRPAISPGVYAKMMRQAKGPFGLGTSLFSIDLRTNAGTFQWSPSAEEMVTEGVHSISGLLTDWKRDNIVFVTSTSAEKTWEIDGRMPCRAVNVWSLTSSCDESRSLNVPKKGFHGETSLLASVVDTSGSRTQGSTRQPSPLIKVDTDFGTSGISIFQTPLNKPRFQTESLQAIASPEIYAFNHASIATSSYFSLPEVAADSYVCGVSAVRFPMIVFACQEDAQDDATWQSVLKDQSNTVLCLLTATNHGDIYQHTLLESNSQIMTNRKHTGLERFEGLPVGTTAIAIPKKLDGRKSSRQRTGSTDIDLFLSNTYPVPYQARFQVIEKDKHHEFFNDILLKRRQPKQPSRDSFGGSESEATDMEEGRQSRIDKSNQYVTISKRPRRATGISIAARDGNINHEMIQSESNDLILPMVPKQPPLRLHAGHASGKNNTEGFGRSDLSEDVIQSSLAAFKDGNDDESTDPEEEEEEEEQYE